MIKVQSESDCQYYTILADTEQKALEWSAVLESQKIYFELKKGPGRNLLFFVKEEEFNTAVENIDAYEMERPFFEKFRELLSSTPAPLQLKRALPCLFFSLLIVLFYSITGSSANKSIWHMKGMLSQEFFTQSRLWCPMTALTIHSDFPHLAGNMIFFIIFGTAVAIQAGAGTALFFVIISGILGNLTTLAVFGESVYNALGFSTSVFGVLGILATLRLMKNVKSVKIWSFYFWIPLIAAGALFGLTGGGAGSDLAGHFFGFFWGCMNGIPVCFLAKFRKNILLQTGLYIFTLMLLGVGWYVVIKAS